MIAGALLFLREALAGAVQRADDAEGVGVPVLGTIAAPPHGRPERRPMSAKHVAEFRLLATRVTVADPPPKRLLIAPASTSVAGLAPLALQFVAVMPHLGRRVVLVDATADATVSTLLNLNGAASAGATPSDLRLLTKVTYVADGTSVEVLPFAAQRMAALAPDRIDELLDEVGEEAVVVVQTDAVASSSHALKWAALADAAIVVVRQRRTRRRDLEATVNALESMRLRVLGTILVK
jgi:Mrp family chromosome partitioning ATPase